MIDLKLVQSNPKVAIRTTSKRWLDSSEFWRWTPPRLPERLSLLKSRRNTASAEVAAKKRAGEDATALLAEMSGVADRAEDWDVETGCW